MPTESWLALSATVGYLWHTMQNISFFSASILSQGNSFCYVGWNFRIRLSSYCFTGFITSLIITKLATTVIASFTSSQTRLSFPNMVCGSQSSSKQQNQIFLENRSENGKVALKRNQTLRNSGQFTMSKMLGNSDLSRKEHPFLGKLYSSRRTSVFGNPLVRDTRVLVSNGRTSGSFLPWVPL